MKKVFILALITIIIGGWWVGRNVGKTNGVVKSVASIETTIPSPTPPTILTNPSFLKIPRLGIDAAIEHVGLDSRKYMDVPKDDMNVGWYNLGARIGEKGSAVVAGHFDTKTGTPAVFFEINKLQPGDEIIVADSEGKSVTFVVTETKTVKDATFPIDEVFARNDVPRLNLITCAGTFDSQNKNYEDRFIVFAVLKDMS